MAGTVARSRGLRFRQNNDGMMWLIEVIKQAELIDQVLYDTAHEFGFKSVDHYLIAQTGGKDPVPEAR